MQWKNRTVAALAGFGALVTLAGAAPRPGTLTVLAAASLTGAFNEIADTMRHREPGLHIDLAFAGSQALALQVQQRAPADVFASADERWMTALRDSNLVSGAPQVFARNGLVVIVPKGNPGRIARLQDLARPGIKLVLAADAVPVGHYARASLALLAKSDGFPPGFDGAVARNIVSNEDNVKGVVAKVQLGEADAGIVYRSDVTPSVAAQVARIEIPDAANVIAAYPIAVLRHAPNAAAARAFVELVLSPVGQAVLARYGFVTAAAVH